MAAGAVSGAALGASAPTVKAAIESKDNPEIEGVSPPLPLPHFSCSDPRALLSRAQAMEISSILPSSSLTVIYRLVLRMSGVVNALFKEKRARRRFLAPSGHCSGTRR